MAGGGYKKHKMENDKNNSKYASDHNMCNLG